MRRNNDRKGDNRKEKYGGEAEAERLRKSGILSSYQERAGRSETEDNTCTAKKFTLGHSEFDGNPSISSKQIKEAGEKATLDLVSSTTNQAEVAQDLNAAKVAAMKTAELGWC